MPPLNKLQKTGLALAISQGLSLSANAATITVNNSGDNGEGCTFREAVELINASGWAAENGCQSSASPFGDNDRILFDVDAVNGLTSEVFISKDVSINPNGEKITISSNGTDRLLTVNSGALVSIDRLVITGGSESGSGGGIIIGPNSFLSLNNSTITNNQAARGGGVFVDDSASLSLNNSTITNNQAAGDGGGVFVYEGTPLSLNNSTISNNTAVGRGGGVFSDAGSELTISNSTVSGNTARDGGGAYFYLTTLSLLNSTITQNSASNRGGGVNLSGGRGDSSTLRNTVIVGNRTDSSFFSELFLYSSVGVLNSSIKQNLIGSQYYSFNQNLQTDNIIANADELPNILSPLADNGGPTLTHALPAGSPAIDAGDSAICAAAPINNLDQRGEPRDANCDIGAFEFIEPEDGGFFVIPLKNGKTVVIPE